MSWLGLPQTATYWQRSGNTDVNGDPSYDAGVAVAVRWKRKDGIVTDEKGNDQKTEFIVYSETLIPKRSMVVLSDVTPAATPTSGARIVMDTIENPSMDNLHKMVM